MDFGELAADKGKACSGRVGTRVAALGQCEELAWVGVGFLFFVLS